MHSETSSALKPRFFDELTFSPVIVLPAEYEVYDFTQGYDKVRPRTGAYGIGRYNERRPGMYDTELFGSGACDAIRDIHIGVDIAAPVGTGVHAFFKGRIYMAAINAAAGDYGGTIITEHLLGSKSIWALHGHLSHESVKRAVARLAQAPRAEISAGELIAEVGAESENGGWNPHLHFQLSWQRPERCDMPGVVNEGDLAAALAQYPDPRWVLGALY